MQDYWTDSCLSINEKLTLFRWRVHMEPCFDGNFKAGRKHIYCPCGIHIDDQEISFNSCPLSQQITKGMNYSTLFSSSIQIEAVKAICQVTKLREELRKKK